MAHVCLSGDTFSLSAFIGNFFDYFGRHPVPMFMMGELSAYGDGNDAGMVVRRRRDLWYWWFENGMDIEFLR